MDHREARDIARNAKYWKATNDHGVHDARIRVHKRLSGFVLALPLPYAREDYERRLKEKDERIAKLEHRANEAATRLAVSRNIRKNLKGERKSLALQLQSLSSRFQTLSQKQNRQENETRDEIVNLKEELDQHKTWLTKTEKLLQQNRSLVKQFREENTRLRKSKPSVSVEQLKQGIRNLTRDNERIRTEGMKLAETWDEVRVSLEATNDGLHTQCREWKWKVDKQNEALKTEHAKVKAIAKQFATLESKYQFTNQSYEAAQRETGKMYDNQRQAAFVLGLILDSLMLRVRGCTATREDDYLQAMVTNAKEILS